MANSTDELIEILNSKSPRPPKPQVEALIVADLSNRHFVKGLSAIDGIHPAIKSGLENKDGLESILRQVILSIIEFEIAVYGSTQFVLSDIGDTLNEESI